MNKKSNHGLLDTLPFYLLTVYALAKMCDELPDDDEDKETEEWEEIKRRNEGKEIHFHGAFPPQVNEVSHALGFITRDMPDCIASFADGSYGEVSVEDLQKILNKIGKDAIWHKPNGEAVLVSSLDSDNYPFTTDDPDDIDYPKTDEEKYDEIDEYSAPTILFDRIDPSKDDLVTEFFLDDEYGLPKDLTFDENDRITFGSIKHLASKLKHTTLLVRMPNGIFEIKNLHLRKVDDGWDTLIAWCQKRVNGVNGMRPYNIMLPSKNPTMEEFVECIGASVVDNKFKMPENIEKDSDGRITFAWLKKFAKAVNAPGKIKVLVDEAYINIEDVFDKEEGFQR